MWNTGAVFDGVFMLMFSRDTSCLTQAAVIVLGVDAGSGTLCGNSIGVVSFNASVALFFFFFLYTAILHSRL